MRSNRRTRENRIPRPTLGWGTRSVFALLVAAAVATPFLQSDAANAAGASAMMIGTAVAGWTFITKAATLPPGERLAWQLLGWGFVIVTVGLTVLAFTWLATDYTAAFGPADLLYLLGYGVAMAGVAILPQIKGSGLQRLRLLIDGIIGAVAVTALLWVFLFAEVAEALTNSPGWERVVGSAYPLFDIMALVVMMIVIVRRSSYRYDPRMVFIAVGVVAQAGADIAFLLTGAGRSFGEAQPVFPLHILAIGSFLAAAVIVDRPIETREYAERPSTPMWALLLPYGAAGAMLLVLVARVRWNAVSPSDAVLFSATLLVGLLVVARQTVAIRENRRYVEDQRTTLVSSISHELRTPLTAMVGFLELLDGGDISDEAERDEMASIVTQQASYLSRVVSDLLMLASNNDSAMELDVASTAVDQLAWASVNVAAVDPAIIRVDAEQGITAFVDTGRMQQALANLLTNAERYGGDQILVIASTDSGTLVIEVHDNGPGVPRKHELMIWERFERGPNRLNASVPGSGIGLAITDAIAKAHGGTAGYRRSERLGGACFWLRLPGRVHTDPSHAHGGHSARSLTIVDGPPDAQSA